MKKARVRAERMSEAQGAELVAEWQESGLSMAAFCRARGLSAHRVSYWRKRLDGSAGGFLVASAGELRAGMPTSSEDAIEVFMGDRFRVRIPVQSGLLEDVLLALGAAIE